MELFFLEFGLLKTSGIMIETKSWSESGGNLNFFDGFSLFVC